MASSEFKAPSRARRSWPVRVYRLGTEPGDDLSATTSVAERLAMMWPLAVEAWAFAGRPIPGYARRETPVSLRPWPPGPNPGPAW